MTVSVLAIDAGTTGVTALVVSERGDVLARGYQEFPQHFPADGWVEHEPGEIWSATLAAVRAALAATDEVPTAVGITNQRETAVLWDRETLGPPRRAIVWQDRRTARGRARTGRHRRNRAPPRSVLHRNEASLDR
jgi:glycerol kinase